MGTRGLYAIVYRGKTYVFYNHFDSYPSGLGVQLVKDTIAAFASGEYASKWKAAFDDGKLIVVDCTDENCRKPS
jgi:hypothetical protein